MSVSVFSLCFSFSVFKPLSPNVSSQIVHPCELPFQQSFRVCIKFCFLPFVWRFCTENYVQPSSIFDYSPALWFGIVTLWDGYLCMEPILYKVRFLQTCLVCASLKMSQQDIEKCVLAFIFSQLNLCNAIFTGLTKKIHPTYKYLQAKVNNTYTHLLRLIVLTLEGVKVKGSSGLGDICTTERYAAQSRKKENHMLSHIS